MSELTKHRARINRQAAKATIGQIVYFALTSFEAQRKLGVKIDKSPAEIAQFARWVAQHVMDSSALVVSNHRDSPDASREARVKAFDQLCYPENVAAVIETPKEG